MRILSNHTRAVPPLVWYTSDAFATGCVVVVLTSLVCLSCCLAYRRRQLQPYPTAVDASL